MSPFSFTRHPRADFSALADGQLSPSKAVQVQQHIDSCDQCHEEFVGIAATRAALSELPEIPAPRSFTLTPEQVAGPARVYEHAPTRTGLVNGLRLGSAGLAMALAIVIFIDASSSGDNGSDSTANGGDAALEIATSTEEYQSSADVSGSENLFDPAPTEVLTPAPPVNDTDGEAGGSGQGGGSADGGVGGTGTTAGGGSGVAPTDAAAPTAVPATPSPTAPPTELSTLTPDEAARASESATEEDKASVESADGQDSGDDLEAAESAADDENSDGGLLALEVLLALGAIGALVASVWVARTSRDNPAGN